MRWIFFEFEDYEKETNSWSILCLFTKLGLINFWFSTVNFKNTNGYNIYIQNGEEI